MTENEVIEELKYDCNEIGKAIPCDTSWGESFENAYAMAINALEEIQQYRTIGTPEECRAAMEKQKPKKPVMDGYCCFESYECPTCHHDISNEQKYCDKCGQKLGDDEE